MNHKKSLVTSDCPQIMDVVWGIDPNENQLVEVYWSAEQLLRWRFPRALGVPSKGKLEAIVLYYKSASENSVMLYETPRDSKAPEKGLRELGTFPLKAGSNMTAELVVKVHKEDGSDYDTMRDLFFDTILKFEKDIVLFGGQTGLGMCYEGRSSDMTWIPRRPLSVGFRFGERNS